VPSTFVCLDERPLTPKGKVNRQALPAPDQSRPELEENHLAPRTPTEQLLAALWSELLKIEWVGIHDNFFVLGGHSLLATQVVSRIRDAQRKEISLRELFQAPTIAELAALIDHGNGAREVNRTKQIMRVARDAYRVNLEK